MKTDDLIDVPLDWAVAHIEGRPVKLARGRLLMLDSHGYMAGVYSPTFNWSQAGKIIEREQISISPPSSRVHRHGGNQPGWGPSGIWTAATWHPGVDGRRNIAHHETNPLVAAMRVYVASKLGAEIDIPKEFTP